MSEQLPKETQSIDLLELLRSELEKRSFHRGQWKENKHIYYCDFCGYSREWVAKHGHSDDCLVRKQS